MEHALTTIQQKIHPQTVTDTVKDDYFFEFLNIPQQRVLLLKESELETLLLDHLRDFIIELGNGFCFEARQKRILIGDEYFFIDMVFVRFVYTKTISPLMGGYRVAQAA